MFLIFDPIYLMLALFGYFLMFIIAAYIAPKVANKFAGKFSLYSSMLILAFLTIFSFSLVIFLIFYFLNSYFEFGITEFSSLLFGIVIFLIISNFLIYLFSPLIINLVYGAKEDEKIQKIVDEVKGKLKYRGKIRAVITRNFNLPNAFAYGNFIFGKYVAITPGMLNLVNEKELRAVIGHEIGHHMHKDNAIMLFFGLLPSIIYFFGYYLIRISFYMRGERDRSSGNVILFLLGVFSVAMSFVIQILVLAFSRLREYFADLEGAKSAGKRNMQLSLAKLHYYYTANLDSLQLLRNSKIRALFILALTNALANPIKNIDEKIEELKNTEVSPLQEFLSTHPPIPKRLRFLDTLPY
ncbi:MAG: zinc metalloprotease HtpX [Candidatus Aenigmatarchaeota archaeon]